ncbi:MAG: hypothetical protein ACKVIR_01105 [Candidatus Poseidoniales archaeon]
MRLGLNETHAQGKPPCSISSQQWRFHMPVIIDAGVTLQAFGELERWTCSM